MRLRFVRRELLKDLLFEEDIKVVLRKPLGIPIFKEEEESIKKLKILIQDFRPKLLISVGDVVSHNLIVKGRLCPDIAIIDYKTMRKKRETPILEFFNKIFHVKNPPSHLLEASWLTISKGIAEALNGKKVVVVVEGEEDLLVIPSLLLSPENSFVIYGQPKEALVVIISNRYINKTFSDFLLNYILKSHKTHPK